MNEKPKGVYVVKRDERDAAGKVKVGYVEVPMPAVDSFDVVREDRIGFYYINDDPTVRRAYVEVVKAKPTSSRDLIGTWEVLISTPAGLAESLAAHLKDSPAGWLYCGCILVVPEITDELVFAAIRQNIGLIMERGTDCG